VETQQSGRPQNDGRAKKACPANEKSTQTGKDTIGGAQVGNCDDQVKEKDSNFAHSGILSKPDRTSF